MNRLEIFVVDYIFQNGEILVMSKEKELVWGVVRAKLRLTTVLTTSSFEAHSENTLVRDGA